MSKMMSDVRFQSLYKFWDKAGGGLRGVRTGDDGIMERIYHKRARASRGTITYFPLSGRIHRLLVRLNLRAF